MNERHSGQVSQFNKMGLTLTGQPNRTGRQVIERSAWHGLAGMLVKPESFGHNPSRAGVWVRFAR
jgi:hypothetical protein